MNLTELQQAAQVEFNEIRSRVPNRLAIHASPRLVILPDRFMRKRGGAAAVYFWLCLSPQILAAPPTVRKAIIAHEWGHIAEGHANAMTIALIGLALYGLITLLSPPGLLWPTINLAILAVMAVGIAWALHRTREFEADAVAADAVGAAAVAEALRWNSATLFSGEQSDDMRERLRRLDARADRERS